MAWEQGRAVVESLIRTGMLEQVPPNLDAAQSLVDVAETHLASLGCSRGPGQVPGSAALPGWLVFLLPASGCGSA